MVFLSIKKGHKEVFGVDIIKLLNKPNFPWLYPLCGRFTYTATPCESKLHFGENGELWTEMLTNSRGLILFVS